MQSKAGGKGEWVLEVGGWGGVGVDAGGRRGEGRKVEGGMGAGGAGLLLQHLRLWLP